MPTPERVILLYPADTLASTRFPFFREILRGMSRHSARKDKPSAPTARPARATAGQSVTVKVAAVRRLAGRYPFGHAADILSADSGLEAGEVADVLGEDGHFIGRGYFHARAVTPLRMLTLEREEIDENFYRRRVRAALARRAGCVSGTNALRVLHAEADGLSGVVADQFGDVLSVQLRNAGAERHRDMILSALKSETGAQAAYERSDTQERLKEGLDSRSGALWGNVPERIEFEEDGLQLFFEWRQAQKTGFFLDQRDNRRLMASLLSAGQSFLDVYSYTGGFSLRAAQRGARALAIDKDAAALATLEAVARANRLSADVRWGDALEVLRALKAQGRQFDAGVLDPPTLAKRREDVPRAKRIFTEGAALALAMLRPGGHLLISSCAHYIGVNDLLDAARVAAGEVGVQAEVSTVTYQPADHPFMLAVPESLYLKSILLRRD